MTKQIISQINNIQDEDELQAFIEVLLLEEVSDEIMDVIEKRQDELYTPTAKDKAEKALRQGLAKKSTPRQAKINARLMAAYKNA